jgi:hypothetical protein
MGVNNKIIKDMGVNDRLYNNISLTPLQYNTQGVCQNTDLILRSIRLSIL